MPYELFIALRYLRAKRRQAVISIITFIAIVSVAGGVMALIIALALMTGARQDFQTKILQGTAHLNLHKRDGDGIENYRELVSRLEQLPHITAAAATVYQWVLIQGGGSSQAAMLKGVDLSARREANEVFSTIIEGNAQDMQGVSRDGISIDGLVLGEQLAVNSGLKVGDIVQVISPEGQLTPGGIAPRLKEFQIVGIFKSGLYEYDSQWMYSSMEAAQRLMGLGRRAQVIQMKVDDIYAVKEIVNEVLATAGKGFVTTDWQELNRPVFAALSLQKRALFVIFLLVIMLASLNIITTLVMMVMEKNRDIAILMSMGATPRSMMLIFIIQGLIIGVVGTVLGAIAGAGLSWYADRYQVIKLQEEFFSISYLPFKVLFWDATAVIALAILVSFAATIYPAWSAARLRPVEGLRYE